MDNLQLALSKAKIQLMSRPESTFFTTVCFSLRHIWDNTIPTAKTNGVNLCINPDFFMELTADERVFVLLHESLHVAYLHTLRGKAFRNQDKFNRAADHVINLQLQKSKFSVPDWTLKDPRFEGLSTEEVYKLLPDDPTCDGGRMSSDIQSSPENTQADYTIQGILIRAAMQSKMAGDAPGSIPGEIQVFLDKLLNPKLPWQQILRKFLNSFAKTDYSFRHPNRRFFPKYHLPSLYGESLGDLAIAVDISGSVSDHDFLRFISEIHGILRMMNPTKISLIQFDTHIKSVTPIKTVQELSKVEFIGRGGTDIRQVMEWANKNKPQALLMFTDGDFKFYEGYETWVPMIWLIHAHPKFEAPFGKVIHYEV